MLELTKHSSKGSLLSGSAAIVQLVWPTHQATKSKMFLPRKNGRFLHKIHGNQMKSETIRMQLFAKRKCLSCIHRSPGQKDSAVKNIRTSGGTTWNGNVEQSPKEKLCKISQCSNGWSGKWQSSRNHEK